MDFVCDSLFNGHRFRALTIVDNYSLECQAIEVGHSTKGQDVVVVMERLVKERSVLDRIQCDNRLYIRVGKGLFAFDNFLIMQEVVR